MRTASDPADEFLVKLEAALAELPGSGSLSFLVAFSGGIDSTVLLNALVRLGLAERTRAVYVDHGLDPSSRDWGGQCRSIAEQLGVGFESRTVEVDTEKGAGVEAAARDARYLALAGLMRPAEALLTAHHGNDQLETVLLRLLRGAGVRGLAAIRHCEPFGPGLRARPLLGFGREEIAAVASAWQLSWIDDPSNAALRFDRGFLRRRVMPVLAERWPQAHGNAARLARHMAEADRLLEDLAALDLGGHAPESPLPLAHMLALTPRRRRNVLRHLIRRRSLPMPDTRQLAELETALEVERADAATTVRWPGAEARIYDGRLYLMPPLGDFAAPAGARLALDGVLRHEHGVLELARAEGAGLPDDWARAGLEIRFRQGGERFRPLGSAHTRTLKQCFQEQRVVPWMRDRIPLLYREGRLVAVADLWLSDDVSTSTAAEPRWRVRWSAHPPLY